MSFPQQPTVSEQSRTALLSGRNIVVKFGALAACDDISVDLVDGEILGIIGPNGSGKTTLLRALCSVHPPTSGKVFWKGEDVTGKPVDQMARRGLVLASQNQMVFEGVRVVEAMEIAHSCRARNREVSEELIGENLIELVGLTEVKDSLASELPLGYLRRLGIGLALSAQPDLLFLDEPAAGLNEYESEELKELLFHLRRDLGITIGIVDHDMRLISSMCDRVIVLDTGKLLFEGTPRDALNDPEVTKAYLGSPISGAQ